MIKEKIPDQPTIEDYEQKELIEFYGDVIVIDYEFRPISNEELEKAIDNNTPVKCVTEITKYYHLRKSYFEEAYCIYGNLLNKVLDAISEISAKVEYLDPEVFDDLPF